MAILLFQPFSHKPDPPLAGTLETIQNPIPSTIPNEKHPETSPVSIKENESVVVDVKGQVHKPGMYTLPMGSRVLDALQIAGGILPTAEDKELNFAAKLVDEMVIYVPFIGEIDVPTTVVTKPGTTTESQSTIININTADETTLTTLSGIGPSKANAIVTYRDEKGLFQSIDELKKVTGIGDLTFEKLKDFISVE
ncbi:helix-hairpin-helix domain-containing protein [Paenisporosarcina antarctica]|uniref:ComEA family DNA-binding protein n=1 Tax=Paenisporosarcina antarctica TaxID=417367 RepID=A0A4P6ZWU8_9BACL|nr:helix-hairpin-helix domain-containing protein [Paenisporosarcina antarctica]QBP40847.1 ComEA family DNA-binding protein [Paenisporosarcina antarctica]